MEDTVISINIFCTLFMTGVIWFVQMVHYPLFKSIGAEQFKKYEQAHAKKTNLVVLPIMLIELVTSIYLFFSAPSYQSNILLLIALALVIVTWVSTIFIQVPLHQKLARGFNREAWTRLINTNWIRTVAWSARAVLLLLLIA